MRAALTPGSTGAVTEDRRPMAGARQFQVVVDERCVAELRIEAELVDDAVHAFLEALLSRHVPKRPALTLVQGGSR